MSDQIKSSLTRILNIHESVVGTGFLISQQHVITCAHVIAESLGIHGPGLRVEAASIGIDFPFIAPSRRMSAKVVCWRLDSPDSVCDEGVDIAILQLAEPPPDGAQPITLKETGPVWAHNFRVFGFPASHDQGVWASGVLRETIVNGWLQIEDTKTAGYLISPGFSGAPVWDSDEEQVVGMIVAIEQKQHARAAFLIPNNILLRTCLEMTNGPRGFSIPKQYADINPFDYGRPVSAERFVGRFEQRLDVKNRIGAITAQCISIVGFRRSGKSSLLQFIKDRIFEFCRPEQRPVIVHLDFQSQSFRSPSGITKGLKRGVLKATGLTLWKNDDDPFEIEDGLVKLKDDGYRLIILIDEFESITAYLRDFENWGDDWRSKIGAGLFVLAICSKRSLDDAYATCGLTSPFGNMFSTTILGAFEQKEWRELVLNGFKHGPRGISENDFDLIDELAGGLPYYTQMAAALLWQYVEHTRIRERFEFQARPRFTELWDDLTDAEQQTIKHIVMKTPVSSSQQGPFANLKLHGVIRSKSVFSSAFAEFVRRKS